MTVFKTFEQINNEYRTVTEDTTRDRLNTLIKEADGILERLTNEDLLTYKKSLTDDMDAKMLLLADYVAAHSGHSNFEFNMLEDFLFIHGSIKEVDYILNERRVRS
jgi:hypothetical protein